MRARPILALAGLSLVVAVGGAFAAGSEGDRGAAPVPPGASEPQGPEAAQLVGRLRAANRVDDAVPNDVAAGPLLSDGAADPSTARRVQRAVGRPGWLMEGRKAAGGRRSVCYVRDGFANCAQTAALAEQGVVPMVSGRGDEISIEGIAADHVKAVDVTLLDGNVVQVPVVDNVFLYETSEPPSEISWDGPQGRKRQSLDWLVKLRDEAEARRQALGSGRTP